MGCFLGCFGLSSNKKRRKPTRRILPRDQRICSYEPLRSSDPTNLNVAENPEKISNSNLRCEAEEKKGTKTRKRVRFNLNVQTYEPIPTTHGRTCSDEDEVEEEEEQRRADVSTPEEKPKDLGTKSSYTSNLRYQNCMDRYEDEDETAYGDSDLEDEDYYTDEDEISNEDNGGDEDGFETEKEELYRGKIDATDAELNVFGTTGGARDRSWYMTQVLNPVQNLAQWKAVKARPAKVKQPSKENIEAAKHDQVKPLLQEIAVDASLSNWLASPKNFNGNVPSDRCFWERSPILDITNLETR